MTGTLAQFISITSYANHFLKTGDFDTDFEKRNSTFQFCNRVDFRDFKKSIFSKPKEVIVANNLIEWFELIKERKYLRLRLFNQNTADSLTPDHKLAGFVGGGVTWYIETVKKDSSDYWTSRWDVTKPNAADQKISTVNYGLTVKDEKTREIKKEINDLRLYLDTTLQEIANFAFKQDLDSFGKTFDNARRTLDSKQPEQNYYHKDLIALDNYSLNARQVLFSAASAWVFGGMGSWNDNGFDDKVINDKYEELSTRLYNCINDSIVGVINLD